MKENAKNVDSNKNGDDGGFDGIQSSDAKMSPFAMPQFVFLGRRPRTPA